MTNKILVTKKQRANLLDAIIRMWPSVPEANVVHYLSTWRGKEPAMQVPTCGTTACFGGWCEWWPPFRKQIGLRAPKSGEKLVYGNQAGWHDITRLFGPMTEDNVDRLLAPRGCHPSDLGFSGTDHALVANRLQWLFHNSVVA